MTKRTSITAVLFVVAVLLTSIGMNKSNIFLVVMGGLCYGSYNYIIIKK